MVTLYNNKLSAMKAVRIALDLSIEEFSNKLGVTSSYISAIENRKKHPQINTLIKILEPFGYTLSITKIKKEFNEQ